MQNVILYAELKQETSHLLTYKAEDLQENSSVAVFIPITFQSHPSVCNISNYALPVLY